MRYYFTTLKALLGFPAGLNPTFPVLSALEKHGLFLLFVSGVRTVCRFCRFSHFRFERSLPVIALETQMLV